MDFYDDEDDFDDLDDDFDDEDSFDDDENLDYGDDEGFDEYADDGDDEFDDGEGDGYGEDTGDGYGDDNTTGKQKKERKKKKNKDGESDEDGEASGSIKLRGKRKLNLDQMNKDARRFGCLIRTQFKCPKCRQLSIWAEPPVQALVRGMIWEALRMQREPRFVCLNAKCKAFYGRHKSRFKQTATGSLQYTHIPPFSDANPFHIDM